MPAATDTLMIGPYLLDAELAPAANGYVGSGVDTRSGVSVFLKQFDRYVMPSRKALLAGSATAHARGERFKAYERRLQRVDRKLMAVCGAGKTLVKPIELVRNGAKLVHVTELVDTSREVAPEEVHRRFARDQVVAMFGELLACVEAIHGQGVVLVDVKDGNLFVLDEPGGLRARLFDYDDAVLEGEVPDAAEVVGTPEYYSPELALYTLHSEAGDPAGKAGSPLASAVGRRHDIFALGLVLHLYLTGELPRDAAGSDRPAWQVLVSGGDEALVLAHGLAPRDRAVIASMLRRNPAERPRSCGEVRMRLLGRDAPAVPTRGAPVAAGVARAGASAPPVRAGSSVAPAGRGGPGAYPCCGLPAMPARPPVSTEGDDLVFDPPRAGGILSLTALSAGKVRIRLADGRTLDKRPAELALYGLADARPEIEHLARARYGLYW